LDADDLALDYGSRAEDGFEKTRRELGQPGEEGELARLEVSQK